MPVITTATGQQDVTPLLGPSIQAAIERAIASVPQEQRGKVELRITLQGIEAEAAVRIMRNVDASLYYQRTKDGQQGGGARIRWSF